MKIRSQQIILTAIAVLFLAACAGRRDPQPKGQGKDTDIQDRNVVTPPLVFPHATIEVHFPKTVDTLKQTTTWEVIKCKSQLNDEPWKHTGQSMLCNFKSGDLLLMVEWERVGLDESGDGDSYVFRVTDWKSRDNNWEKRVVYKGEPLAVLKSDRVLITLKDRAHDKSNH